MKKLLALLVVGGLVTLTTGCPSASTPNKASSNPKGVSTPVTPPKTPDKDKGLTPDKDKGVTPDKDKGVTPDKDKKDKDKDKGTTPDKDKGTTPDKDKKDKDKKDK